MDPLFLDDLEQVKTLLRLKQTASGGPAEYVLSFSVQEARTTFYAELGLSRIAELKAIPFSPSPSTDNEYLRSIANEVELDLIWFFLLKRMPTGVKAGTGEFLDSWNTEGAARNLSLRETERLRASLWNSPDAGILKKMDLLRADIVAPSPERISGSDLTEDTDTPDLLYL